MARTCGWCTALIVGIAVLEADAKHVDVRNPESRARAVAAFRAHGPEGLAAALDLYDELEKQHAQLQATIARFDAASGKVAFSKAAKSSQPEANLVEARRQLADVTA